VVTAKPPYFVQELAYHFSFGRQRTASAPLYLLATVTRMCRWLPT
jgi:hypothetical protein